MPDKVIDVPGVGTVSFPDAMSDDDIGKAISAQHPQSAPPAGPPSMIDNLENMAGRATSYIKNLASKPIPTVSAQDQAQFPQASKVFQQVSDFAGKPLIPQSVNDYVSDVSKHASTITGNPKATAALQGIDRGAGRVAESLSTPANIGTMAAMMIPGVGEAAGLGFGLQGGAQAIREGVAAKGAYDKGDVGGTAEHATSGLINAAFAGIGLKGLIHDETPLANPQAPEVPVADHPLDRNQSVAVPGEGEKPLAQNGVTDAHQMQLMPWQGNLFPKGAEPETTAPSTPDLNQLLLNPAQGRLFSVKGEALPPQEATAGPMSPAAEAISKAAQDKVNPEPTSPSVTPTPEGPTGSDQISKLEDSIRTQTGQVMRLNHLEKGNQIHAALERGIDETQGALDPRARNVGSGITPEDQKILSIALGEKVTSVLTPDQMDKAYSLRGKVMSETPELQLRPRASEDRIARSRVEMAKDIATTQDPDLKAKLQAALQPGEDGKPQPFLYEPARKNAPAVALDADHPEAPFAPKAFGAQYPDISLDNWETALGYRPRAVDHGLGDPELKAQLKGLKAPVTAEGVGTVRANPNGFTYDTPNNPKGINGDAKLLKNQILEGAVRTRTGQIASQLRDNVKAYQSLRDSSKPSPLIDQLKGLHPDSLPKEVRDLVKPPKSEASPTNASASTSVRPKTAEARNSPEAPKGTTLGKAKEGIKNLYGHFMKNSPEHLKDAQDIISKAAEHFGNDTDGAVVASYHALKVFKQGIEQDDPYAMRSAIKEIRRLTPLDDANAGGGLLASNGARNVDTRTPRAASDTFYTGLDPAIAKGIAKDIGKAVNYVKPTLTPEDLVASADYAANAKLSRYEKMTPLNRSAYKAQLWSDELDRDMAEGDPDGSKGYHDRLEALRKTTQPDDLYSRMKDFVQKNEKQIISDDTSRMIRSANGSRYVNDLRMETVFNKFSSMVDRWSNHESRDFIHKMELGMDQGDSMKNDIAGMLRKSLDEARDRITEVNGNFQEYLENYFPHIWSNVGKGQELTRQLRGMSGNESFLKNRELETFNQGILKGLAPVTYNPLKLTMMRVEQMNRYAMKEQLKQDFISSNKAVLIKGGESVPDGLVPLEDRAFETGGGLGGRYYAPEAVAKVFNNFTSTGLSGKAVIPVLNLSAYDLLRSANNTLNQFQLGLSGLHGTFTLTNSVISEVSRGLAKGVNGDIAGGLKTALSSLNVPGRYSLGKNLIAHLKDQNSFQEMSSLADAFQRAGGRVGVDKILGTAYADKFKTAYKDAMDEALPTNKKVAAWGRTVTNGVGAALEWSSHFIMEKWVPQLKMGAFAKSANEILAENVGRPSAEIDGKLQQAWDNVDDRFGQMVYDNLFWNKTTKDIAMLTTRAPGWNIGTYRGLGGGVLDLARSVRDAATRKERLQITDRTAYLGAVVASTMALNAMAQMAMTGSGPGPLIDYFYPKTGSKDGNGEENRVMPKMYTYDYINAWRDPIGTTLHKVSPLLGTLYELHANKSFYGRQIWDPGSSLGGRVAQMVGYAMKQYEPFSLSNYQESKTRGASGLMPMAGSVAGVLPAPKWAGRSSAEQLAAEYHADSMAQGGEEGDVFDKHQKYVQLQSDVKNGKVTPEDLSKRVNSGEIPVSFLDHIYDKQQTPNLERWTKTLSPTRAMKVFDRATPEEKQRLIPILVQKMDKLDLSEIPAYAQKINDAQHHPDTHVFSVSQWSAAHPGEDEKAAETQARQQGFEVQP